MLPIRALARFWSVALGWPITIDETDEVVIEPPADDPAQEGQIPLVFVPVPEPKTTKNRIHLDLASTSADHQRAMVTRLGGFGARQIDIGQRDVSWVVIAPAFTRIAKRRGRDDRRVAAASRLLNLIFYGLRDGEIRCPHPGGRLSTVRTQPRRELEDRRGPPRASPMS
ncbi:MAG: VOC family protein [Acidimicrobiales bacterium]